MKHIAILASGTGSNAENIARQFEGDKHIAVDILLCDREEAPVLEKMKRFGIPTQIFPRADWRSNPQPILELLQSRGIDLIVLAGFTSFIPDCIVKAYERRIINLHPSLLPKFGGKGMWGMNVHRAVIEAGEKESGITIHYVSEEVDGGEIIAQFRCEVTPDDTPETLVARIHVLEHRHLPEVIRQLLEE